MTSPPAKEKIFIHLNSTFFLTGENLFYKIYCLNAETNTLSKISKISYVELVAKNKNVVFSHKIRLESGLGQGDFFIPASLVSGNYKLIAYTQWMRNEGENYFFQSDIFIINPFQSNQNDIIDNNDIDSLLTQNNVKKQSFNNKDNFKKNVFVEMALKKKEFTNREKVVIKINSLKDNKAFGDYSISIRKIENNIQIPPRQSVKNYFSFYSKQIKSNSKINKHYFFLPELRGELISGRVFNKNSKTPSPNVKIAMSIPGKNFILKFSTTNQEGVFYFYINKKYKNPDFLFQILDNKTDNLELVIDIPKSINYNNLQFANYKITKKVKESILKHTIYNQIENAYLSVKPNPIIEQKAVPPFFANEIDLDYYLDDYTRFPTLKETILEVIDQV